MRNTLFRIWIVWLVLWVATPVLAEDPAVAFTLERFYESQGPVLRQCRERVFGDDAQLIPDTLLEFAARPDIDRSRTRNELSRLRRRHLPPGRLLDGLPVPPPHGGPRGAIIIVREWDPRLTPDGFLRVYVHELGNLLDFHLHPQVDDDVMRHYGRADDPSGDDDTGQQFERCVDELGGFEPPALLQASRERTPDERQPLEGVTRS